MREKQVCPNVKPDGLLLPMCSCRPLTFSGSTARLDRTWTIMGFAKASIHCLLYAEVEGCQACCSAGSATTENHDKLLQRQCFLPSWMPPFAGMTTGHPPQRTSVGIGKICVARANVIITIAAIQKIAAKQEERREGRSNSLGENKKSKHRLGACARRPLSVFGIRIIGSWIPWQFRSPMTALMPDW
jgi:hypothetical protein